MLKDKKINIAETNMALFGTPIEKEIKKFAAETEAAWKGIGQEEGLKIWRIEKFQVVAWPEESYGKFHSGDSYIVLKTTKVEEKLIWDVHFWLGKTTSQDEAGTAAYKTVELDDFLDGYPVQHREVQGHESKQFLSYFAKMEILPGGIATGFKHVEAEVVRTRLIQVKGGKKTVITVEKYLSSASLNSGDVFLLDDNLNTYLFVGQKASIKEKTKGAQLQRGLDDERGSKVENHVIGEHEMGDTDDHINKFWELLGGRIDKIKDAKEGGADDATTFEKKMFQVNDEGGITTTEVPFARSSLTSADAFVIDVGAEVFVWVGSGSTPLERKSAMLFGQKYLTEREDRPNWTPITRVMDSAENEALLSHF